MQLMPKNNKNQPSQRPPRTPKEAAIRILRREGPPTDTFNTQMLPTNMVATSVNTTPIRKYIIPNAPNLQKQAEKQNNLTLQESYNSLLYTHEYGEDKILARRPHQRISDKS